MSERGDHCTIESLNTSTLHATTFNTAERCGVASYASLRFVSLKACQTSNDYLADWLPFRDRHIQILLDRQGFPTDLRCQHCGVSEIEWRCSDCVPQTLLCSTCCLSAHRNNQLHRTFKWTGDTFQPVSLSTLGLVLHLGYKQPGIPCIECRTQEGSIVTIVDVSGIHEHPVSYCTCRDALPVPEQSLYAGFHPSTFTDRDTERTLFTMAGLSKYRSLNLECQTTYGGFHSWMRRETNPHDPYSVPVSE